MGATRELSFDRWLGFFRRDFGISFKDQQLHGFDELKELKLPEMPGLVNESSRLREIFFKIGYEKDRLTMKKMVVFASATEIYSLKTRTTFSFGFSSREKDRAFEIKRKHKKAQGTIAMSSFRGMTLKRKDLFLMQEVLSARVKCAILRADLDTITTFVQWFKKDVRKLLPTVYMKVRKTYEDMVDPVE